MAGSVSEDNGAGRCHEGLSSGERCQSGDSLAEWRYSEQVEDGTPSTSPPYWDSEDDDGCGPKPSELYGKFTWKIENFSQISKRELRSNAFEVGGYKWYILIYPQGCDVCNHLSLFLCVANHDKLLPGWSHFAQFTIAVVNKDPKKSKYSDTLHRFWKKEHDWGWKKFMELSKVLDGFIVSDTLVIKAQVQVIRERTDRPFRCLDCQYRRELVRVYLSNVEILCRRFVEDQRTKLRQLIDDKVRWSSFHSFWLGLEQSSRSKLSSDRADAVLKMIVKTFFVEKEVTSTLVMDSLYSGLKSLESQAICKTQDVIGGKARELKEIPFAIMRAENDMFVLADDVLLLLEKIAIEPLPPKDDKGPQNRMKDGSSGEDFSKDSVERDENRLTELGRRTVEIFVLAHIFSTRIEVAYQEAVALKRQEELIREEEAAGQAESENRVKRAASEKEKRSKKKQPKHKRNNRKGKEKGKLEKSDVIQDKSDQQRSAIQRMLETDLVIGKIVTLEDASDISDVDGASEVQHLLEDRDLDHTSWDSDASELLPMEVACSKMDSSQEQSAIVEKRSIMDDSSSTCSTDSAPSVVINGPCKESSLAGSSKNQMAPIRRKQQSCKSLQNHTQLGHEIQVPGSAFCWKREVPESEAVVFSLKDQVQQLELSSREKDVIPSRKPSIKDRVVAESLPEHRSEGSPMAACSSQSPSSNLPIEQAADTVKVGGQPLNTWSHVVQPASSTHSEPTKSDIKKVARPGCTLVEKTVPEQATSLSRPSSAPVIPATQPSAPAFSLFEPAPLLARSASAVSRLSMDPTSYMAHSHGRPVVGTTVGYHSAVYTSHSTSSLLNSLPHCSPCGLDLSPMSLPSTGDDGMFNRQAFTFGTVTSEILTSPLEVEQQQANCTFESQPVDGKCRLGIYEATSGSPKVHISADVQSRQSQDEFPHLDIINYLLDEEHGISRVAKVSGAIQNSSSGHYHHLLSQQLDLSTEFETQSGYSHSNYQYGMMRDSLQVCLSGYASVQLEEVLQSHWPVTGMGLSVVGSMTAEGEGCYPHYLQDFSNITGAVNTYPVFRPENGF